MRLIAADWERVRKDLAPTHSQAWRLTQRQIGGTQSRAMLSEQRKHTVPVERHAGGAGSRLPHTTWRSLARRTVHEPARSLKRLSTHPCSTPLRRFLNLRRSTSGRCRSTGSRCCAKHHRAAPPLLAPSFSSLRISADVVFCSSSGSAHGASVDGRKVVYCHTPPRWLYQSECYLRGRSRPIRTAAGLFRVKSGAVGQAGGGIRRLLPRQLDGRRGADHVVLRSRRRGRGPAAGDHTRRPKPDRRRS